jgi:hypothetical protein
MTVFWGTGSKLVKQWTRPIVMGKTIARFLGLLSLRPSHMAAWTRVSFLILPLVGESFFWANACDKKEAKKIKSRKDMSLLRIIDMFLGLLLDPPC